MRACAYMYVCRVYNMCVPVVECIRHDDERSVISAIVHRPPARSRGRSIVCIVYIYMCVTSSFSFHEQHIYVRYLRLPSCPRVFTLHASRRGALNIL